MTKDTDEQSSEEIYRTRFERVLSAGAFVPRELGCVTTEVGRCVLQPGSLSRRHVNY